MKNIQLEGRVIDENSQPLSNLIIMARDIDKFSRDDSLGQTTTDTQGYFKIVYSSAIYRGLLDTNPDIVVTVMDPLGIRELAASAIAADIRDIIYKCPDIVIHRSSLSGWLAKVDKVEPSRFTAGNSITPLIDNDVASLEIVRAIENAQSTIHLMQLWWAIDYIATFRSDDQTNIYYPQTVLTEVILAANRRGVRVRILLNENAVTPDSVDEITKYFRQNQPNDVSVRPFPLTISTMHAKSLVVDGEDPERAVAFILGSPMEQGYWDTSRHSLNESRREPGALGIGNRPIHDVSIKLRGPSVAFIEELFATLWNHRSLVAYSSNDIIRPVNRAMNKQGAEAVQIVRTLPSDVLSESPDGETGIREAYLRAMINAQHYIYLENQYFTDAGITQAIIQLLKQKPNLEIILLINQKLDIPTYLSWQKKRLRQIGIPHPRVGVFTLWTTAREAGRLSIQRCYVHSKVAIIDDQWATIGTANLDGISLIAAQEFETLGPIALEATRNRRSVELNSVLIDGIENQPHTGSVKRLRNALWSEHFGFELSSEVPEKGWLAYWNQIAYSNVSQLNAGIASMRAIILPYSFGDSDRAQLQSVGVDTSQIHFVS